MTTQQNAPAGTEAEKSHSENLGNLDADTTTHLAENSTLPYGDAAALKFVSGLGQYHTDKHGKPYLSVTLADIRAMVDNPPSVPKAKGRWFIPSTLPSRTFATQQDCGQFGMLWADLDKDPKPLSEVCNLVGENITGYRDVEVYASRSAKADYQKGRVLIPLARPLSGADWLICQKVLNDKLEAYGMPPDRKSEGCAQLCYLPNRGEFYAAHHWRNGEIFDPLASWSVEIETAREQAPPHRTIATNNGNIGGVHDHVVDFLFENGLVIEDPNDGRRLFVECPNADQHTTESGKSAATWFRAGTNEYAQGHFKCQHDHCKQIDAPTFKRMIGYDVDGFDVIESPIPMPPFARIERGNDAGKIESSRNNLVMALARPDLCGYRLRFDTFLDDLMIAEGADGGEWVRFNEDVHFMRMAIRLESGTNGFRHIPEDMLRKAVIYVCRTQIFDTAQAWLSGLEWDGVKRVDNFLARYAGADDTEYARAVSRYWWSALAGRVIQPGVKADMALIAVGVQGLKKSSLVEAMAPLPGFAGEIDLAAGKDDIARTMRGKLVLELGELSGFSKKTVEDIKAFISRQKEEWTPKFKEFTTIMPRRCLFFGTTNTDEILVDETGNRRWLPFRSKGADPAGLITVRDQLWAEGAHLFKQHGVMWQDAERLAKDEHAEFTVTDPWDSAVRQWLYTDDQMPDESGNKGKPADRRFENSEALQDAVNVPVSVQTKALEMRMGKILIRFGFERVQERVKKDDHGTRSHRWVYQRKL